MTAPVPVRDPFAELNDAQRDAVEHGLDDAEQAAPLLVPQRFYVTQQGRFADQHMYAALTRFISPAVARVFEAVAPTKCRSQAGVAEETLPALDLQGRARSMWG
jgi:DNA helicase-2/ATP-dependent DNA helicase PcrA